VHKCYQGQRTPSTAPFVTHVGRCQPPRRRTATHHGVEIALNAQVDSVG